jgi:hypothetical protein
MEKSPYSFSIKRIISSDYTAGIFIAFPFTFWIMFLIFQDNFFEIIAILMTSIGIPVFIWRIHFFKTLYSYGVEITGIITFTTYTGRGDRIIYEYTFDNRKYSSGNAVAPILTKDKNYNIGDEVLLVVDPKNPKRAVIKELYF